jgi:hypothetical protein
MSFCKPSFLALPVCLLITLSVACGDDSDPVGGASAGGASAGGTADGGAPPGNDFDADAYCEQLVAREEQCAVENPTTVPSCLSNELTVCLGGGIRDGVREAIVECVLELPCDAPGDGEACVYGPGEESPVAGQAEFKAACLDKVTECASQSDDNCGVNFFDAPAYEAMSACLGEDCATFGDCLDGVIQESCAG